MNRGSSFVALLLVVASAAATPLPASATPTVDLSWNECSPIVPTLERGAPGPITLFASVVGQDQGHMAYQVFLYLDSPPPFFVLPDAWRFDADGCQGSSRVEIRHVPTATVVKACPAMQGPQPGIQIKEYTFDPLVSRARCVLATAYPPGVESPNPAIRYFLMAVVLDHTNSVTGGGTPGVTCGGFERDVVIDFDPNCVGIGCGHTPNPIWLDLQGNEHEFAIGNGSLRFCGSCEPVPAAASTWGMIKGRYRR